MRIWLSHRVVAFDDDPDATESERGEGWWWPYPPEWTVRFDTEDSPYVVDVEISKVLESTPQITGFVIRTGFPKSPSGKGKESSTSGAEYQPLTAREVQRLPLSRFARAALALAADAFSPGGLQEAKRILMPRGRPSAGADSNFYAELLAAARELEKQGIAPVPEIARRKRVDPNVVHQWLHRARRPGRPPTLWDRPSSASRDSGSRS